MVKVPFKLGNKIFDTQNGDIATVIKITKRGFEYKLCELKPLIPRWDWTQTGGECFLDVPYYKPTWELWTGDNKIVGPKITIG